MVLRLRALYLFLVVTILGFPWPSGGVNTSSVLPEGVLPDETVNTDHSDLLGDVDVSSAVNLVNATVLTSAMDATQETDVFEVTGAVVEDAQDVRASLARTSRGKREKKKTGAKKKKSQRGEKKKKAKGNKGNTKRNKGGTSGVSKSMGDWRTTGITFYGQTPQDDNGVGITGVDLFKYGRAGVRYQGRTVYPAAVFQGDAARYLYKVLEVKSEDFKRSKSVLLHVVDACNSGQSICRKNVKKYGPFLIDVHETATGVIGVDDGLLKGSFRVVGELKPSSLPERVWKNNVVLCGCKGSCRGSEMDWGSRGSC